MSNRGNNVVDGGIEISEPVMPVRRQLLNLVALLEIITFLGIALLVDQLFLDGTRFSLVEPHPFWVIVILLSVQYGTRMGLLAAFASSAVFLFGNLPERLLEQDMHQWFLSSFRLPILWSVAAVIVGELSARHIGARVKLSKELSDSLQREATLAGSFRSLNTIKERLEIRMAGQWRTVSKTLKTARALEQHEPSQILGQSLDLVASLLGPEKFSIYTQQDKQLKLAYERGWRDDDNYLRQYPADHPVFTGVVGEERMLCISKTIDEKAMSGQGVLAGPLIVAETGQFLGMLKIEKMAFGQFSLNSIRDFEFLCDWISAIYGKAIENKNRNEANSSETFKEDYLTSLAKRMGFSLAKITIQLSDYPNLPLDVRANFTTVLEQSLEESLRYNDVLVNSEGEFSLFLPGTENQYVNIAKTRLQESLDQKLKSLPAPVDYTLNIQRPVTGKNFEYAPISIASAAS